MVEQNQNLVLASASGLLGVLGFIVLFHAGRPSLFFRRFGQTHRAAGLAYLTWLVIGVSHAVFRPAASGSGTLLFDVVLACLGILLTLSAARDFPSSGRVKNAGSGTLEDKATVTTGTYPSVDVPTAKLSGDACDDSQMK